MVAKPGKEGVMRNRARKRCRGQVNNLEFQVKDLPLHFIPKVREDLDSGQQLIMII